MSKEPLISVITPSFNCGAYIRDCIESVLAQNYENFEHIIVDGASTDSTVEILKQYPHLKWLSEPDTGEAEALNKGLRMARGDIIGWLNADDYYLEGTFHRVAQELDSRQGRHLVYGKTNILDEKGSFLFLGIPVVPATLLRLVRWFCHLQIYEPSMFYSKALVNDVGFFREDLSFSIDYDYWLRINVKGYQFHFVDQVFANARLVRSGSKSSALRSRQEQSWLEVSLPYLRRLTFFEQTRFWKDYWFRYRLPGAIAPVRRRLRLRSRMRHALRCIQGKSTRAADSRPDST